MTGDEKKVGAGVTTQEAKSDENQGTEAGSNAATIKAIEEVSVIQHVYYSAALQ